MPLRCYTVFSVILAGITEGQWPGLCNITVSKDVTQYRGSTCQRRLLLSSGTTILFSDLSWCITEYPPGGPLGCKTRQHFEVLHPTVFSA